jgi:hypothetical protein
MCIESAHGTASLQTAPTPKTLVSRDPNVRPRETVARNFLIISVAALVLGGALALVPYFDSQKPGESVESDETATPTPTTVGTTPTEDAASEERTARSASFEFGVRETEPCGRTCRDVTVALTNTGGTAATNVTIFTRVFAGNTTTDRSLIWDEQEAVGTLAAGRTVTSTRRIELGFGEAAAVWNNDGWITVVTVVTSDDDTARFTQRVRVN